MGDKNSWLIVKLEERSKTDPNWFEYIDDKANFLRKDIRNYITLKIVNDIEDGYIGAVITSDEDADGYYLIKWSGTPYTAQDSGELVCDGKYLNPVGRAPKWYTTSEDADTILVQHVVLGKVIMEEISASNPLPKTCNRRKATSMGALKISQQSDDYIFDEIHRRDALEDPEFED